MKTGPFLRGARQVESHLGARLDEYPAGLLRGGGPTPLYESRDQRGVSSSHNGPQAVSSEGKGESSRPTAGATEGNDHIGKAPCSLRKECSF